MFALNRLHYTETTINFILQIKSRSFC